MDRLDRGQPILHFEDIPLDWTEFRLMLRQTADILQRFDARTEGPRRDPVARPRRELARTARGPVVQPDRCA
jgi:hypothetical protein